VIVSGRVQGVGFRQFVRSQARTYGLSGWIKNRDDGKSVELEAEGPTENLEQFLSRVNAGPPGARVDQVDIEWTTRTSLPQQFEIRR
jgi:acylphosphatase